MRVSIVLGHPRKGSLNHAIADIVVRTLTESGYSVAFHDLYAEGFDAVVPFEELAEQATLPPQIQQHCDEIAVADAIVVVHPNWWGQPPAILKGWIDRVLRPGVAYRFLEEDSGEGVPIGLLKARTALVFNTSNTPPQREFEVFGDPLERLWRHCIFGLCGVTNVHRETFSVVVTSTVAERQGWLASVRATVRERLVDVLQERR